MPLAFDLCFLPWLASVPRVAARHVYFPLFFQLFGRQRACALPLTPSLHWVFLSPIIVLRGFFNVRFPLYPPLELEINFSIFVMYPVPSLSYLSSFTGIPVMTSWVLVECLPLRPSLSGPVKSDSFFPDVIPGGFIIRPGRPPPSALPLIWDQRPMSCNQGELSVPVSSLLAPWAYPTLFVVFP